MGVLRSISRGVALASAAIAGGALAVTASSVLATPQPLESALEGERHLFRFREGDVFYTAHGPVDAPPVLLLHSVHLSASSYEWRKNFHALSQNFRVYAPDLLGFGLSDRPALDYTAEVYVHLVSDFVREVIARPTIVVARNHCAPFTVRAAYLDSRFFTRLVLMSPTGILPHTAEEHHDWAVRSGDALQRLLRGVSDNTAGQVPFAFLTTRPALSWLIARQSYAHPELVTPDVVEHLYATTHQFGARFAPLAFMSGKLDLDVTADFAALQQPILLIWGAQDAINDPMHAEALTMLNPHSRLELIAHTGNAAQEERAEEVNELLHAWCLAPTELVDPTFREQTQAPSATPPAAATTAAPLTTPLPETPTEAAKEEAGEVPPEAFATADTQMVSAATDAEAAAEAKAGEETPAAASQTPEETHKAPASEHKPPRRAAQQPPTPKTGAARPHAPGQARQSKAAQQGTERGSARQARPDSNDKPQPPRPSGSPRQKS